MLFWAGQFAANHGVATFLKKVDFHSFFDRGILIAAVALLWPLARSLRIRKLSDFGLQPNPHPVRDVLLGLAIAILSSLILTAWAAALHAWRMPEPDKWKQVLASLVTAAVVPVLEESLFRGAMQGLIGRSAPKRVALIFVAALFASVHFVRPPQQPISPLGIGWGSGFALVPKVFWQFQTPILLLGGFTTLFLVALTLGLARQRTASLWLPCGLHAGWIIGKSIGTVGWVKPGRHGLANLPWFGPDLLTGLAPVLILLVTFAFVYWRVRQQPLTERQRRDLYQPGVTTGNPR